MLKYRIISFPLLLILAASVVFWEQGGPWIFGVLSVGAMIMAVLESANLLEKLQGSSYKLLAVLASLGLLGCCLSNIFLPTFEFYPEPEWFIIGTLVLAALGTLFTRHQQRAGKALMGTPGVVMFAAVPILALCSIYFDYGAKVFLVLVLTTKAADTGGYIVGVLTAKLMKGGNHKIVPSISPKKSWEGTIGAWLFSLGVAWLFNRWEFIDLSCVSLIIFGTLAFLGSFAGDLTESQLKRAAEIKDSGSWIPGMGGILDVLDSFIYNAPLFYLALEKGWIECL